MGRWQNNLVPGTIRWSAGGTNSSEVSDWPGENRANLVFSGPFTRANQGISRCSASTPSDALITFSDALTTVGGLVCARKLTLQFVIAGTASGSVFYTSAELFLAPSLPALLLTTSRSSLLGLKKGMVLGGTSTRSPDLGLRPMRP